MATITTANLIAKFQYALDNKWGYVLNTWHTLWTQAMQNSLVSQMRSKYGDNWKLAENYLYYEKGELK